MNGSAELLDHRFELHELLGRGAQGSTFRGLDRTTGRPVAIKELSLHHVDSWKAVELFEREGQMLRRLDHRAIPDYVATLHVEGEDGRERFFLVQELVDGRDLKTLLDEGYRFSEDEALDFLGQILEILLYLQSLSPVVIHRDIKPSNILRRPEGSFALIDFGAVQAVMPAQGGGSTVVGTTGYMPVEQFMGRADTSTDLYSLAATTVHLLSGRHPNDLPMEDLRLRFEDAVNISPALKRFLARMLAPEANRRFRDAREALTALGSLGKTAAQDPHRPQPGLRPRDLLIMAFLMAFIFAAPMVCLVLQQPEAPAPQPLATDFVAPTPLVPRAEEPAAPPAEEPAVAEAEPSPEPAPKPRKYPKSTKIPPSQMGPFKLGMSLDDARAAVPNARAWRLRTRGRPMPPGDSWLIETEFLGHPMECDTFFCEEEGICSIFCTIRHEFPVEEHHQLGDALVAFYRDLYGSETRYFYRDGSSERIFWWTHPQAELVVRAQSDRLENIRGTHGHSIKRLDLESAYYTAWHKEDERRRSEGR